MLHDITTLCESIASTTGISHVTVKLVARKLFESIQSTLKAQDTVLIPDFGKFTFKHRRAKVTNSLDGSPATYSPANSKLTFIPDRHWENWQRVHSSQIPDQLPPGTRLGIHLSRSHRVRSEYPQHADFTNNTFMTDVVIPRAIRKKNK